MHLFVAPHLDDVALSCGGLVARLARAGGRNGERALIATACTADAPAGAALSDAARHEHAQWRLGDQPYAARREEDVQACAALGAEAVHLGLLDAIYRAGADGAPLYTRNFMDGVAHPEDLGVFLDALKAQLQPLVAGARWVYAPLTLGGHVDHILVRRAIEALTPPSALRYYEDYPYAEKAGDIERAPQAAGLRWERVALAPADADARIDAVARYTSQLPILFGSAAVMPERVRGYIAQAGGERYWRAGSPTAQ